MEVIEVGMMKRLKGMEDDSELLSFHICFVLLNFEF